MPRSRIRRALAPWPRRLARLALAVAIGGFVFFLGRQLQQGYERRAPDSASEGSGAAGAAEDGEEFALAIELTEIDEQGRAIRITAREAIGRSDDLQRFLDVEVRVPGAYGEHDAVIVADELVLKRGPLTLEFLGNALLSTEGLELSGPELRFQQGPRRLWSYDPVQFETEEFIGIAGKLNFQIDGDSVSLNGVAARPTEPGGFSVVADWARFDRATANTELHGDVEITSSRLALTSPQRVMLIRDREQNRMASVWSDFGTELRLLSQEEAEEEPAEEATLADAAVEADAQAKPAEPADGEADEVVLAGDELSIELAEGRTPSKVSVIANPMLAVGMSDLRGNLGFLFFGEDGSPERFELVGAVDSRLEAGLDGGYLLMMNAERMELHFDDEGEFAAAQYQGTVEANYGRASISADAADWDGKATLTLSGNPRVTDSSLVELESDELALIVGEEARVEAKGTVTAQFRSDRLDWLPGNFEEAGLTSNEATLETGEGRGAFSGDVRLLFGGNRLLGETVEVDAEAGTLRASGEVESSFEFEAEASPDDADESEDGAPESEASATGAPWSFEAWAGRMEYTAADSRLSYDETPRLEHRSEAGDLSRVVAASIEAALLPDGTVGAVSGTRGARFERGDDRVRGARIRYEPSADRLEAWGSPAVVTFEDRTSEGGHLEVLFEMKQTEIGATRAGRVITRVRVEGPES